jgi:hypothetical protein
LDKNIDIEELTTKITEPFKTDIEKTRAIYFWIASNIKYDYAGVKTNSWTHYPSESSLINDTFRFKKGFCSGYSHLFKYMLELCNIECEVINGYSRTTIDDFSPKESDHAWNSIKINNKWSLYDVTWATDSLGENIHDFWFNTNPNIFIMSHFPIDDSWTLTEKKYSLEDFYQFPIYTTYYYYHNFSQDYSSKGFFKICTDTVLIKLRPNIDCLILPKLYDIEKKVWTSPKIIDRTKDLGYFSVILTGKGEFILSVKALYTSDSEFSISPNIVFYMIENENKSKSKKKT